MGYSMPNPSFYKNSCDTNQPVTGGGQGKGGFPTFPKVNTIVWLQFEPAYYDVAVYYISYYAMRIPTHHHQLQTGTPILKRF